MFVRLIQKELLHHLLDSRFAVVFAFCILLSGLGTYAGIQNHSQQRQQYQAVAVKNRELIEKVREKGGMFDLEGYGYRWNRRPEPLSPVVYGLSGALGQEVLIQYRRYPRF
jgi:hypothetical protein